MNERTKFIFSGQNYFCCLKNHTRWKEYWEIYQVKSITCKCYIICWETMNKSRKSNAHTICLSKYGAALNILYHVPTLYWSNINHQKKLFKFMKRWEFRRKLLYIHHRFGRSSVDSAVGEEDIPMRVCRNSLSKVE